MTTPEQFRPLTILDGDIVAMHSTGPGSISVRAAERRSGWLYEGGGAQWRRGARASGANGPHIEAVIQPVEDGSPWSGMNIKVGPDEILPDGTQVQNIVSGIGVMGGKVFVYGEPVTGPQRDPSESGTLVVEVAKNISNLTIVSVPEGPGDDDCHAIVGMEVKGLVFGGSKPTLVRQTKAREVEVLDGAQVDFDQQSFDHLPPDVQAEIRPLITVDKTPFQAATIDPVGKDGGFPEL